MNRRGFLWAAVAAGLALVVVRGPAEAPATPDPDALIRTALREHRALQFTYQELPRRVEPHALGRMKDGTLVLLAWQSAGDSHRGPPPGWRNFFLHGITRPALSPDRFTPRPDYRPEKTRLREIIAEVAP